MKPRTFACIILLAAALGAAPARSQVFTSGDDASFDATGTGAFGPLAVAGTNNLFLLTVTSTGNLSAQTGTSATTTAAATASAGTGATLAITPSIAGFSYQSVNGVTYTKTATGLLVVLSPAALTGSGPLAGHTGGLTIEIPNASITQLF